MAETIPRLLIGHGMEDDGDCKHDSSLHVMSNQKCPALFLGVEETYLFGTSRKWTLPPRKYQVPVEERALDIDHQEARTSRDNTTKIKAG